MRRIILIILAIVMVSSLSPFEDQVNIKRNKLVDNDYSGLITESVEWARVYEGEGITMVYCVKETFDGGFIVAAYPWLLKLDSSGEIEWQRNYVSTSGSFSSVRQTADSGYIACGYVITYDDYVSICKKDFLVMKLSPEGSIEWQKIYGRDYIPEYYTENIAVTVEETVDSGYIVGGHTMTFGGGRGSTNIWILKLNAHGNIEWQKSYGGPESEYYYDDSFIQETNDGGYVVAAKTRSFGAGGYDFWLLKLSQGGDIEWQKTYGGTGSDLASAIKQTLDGGYIVAGESESFSGTNKDFWILKITSGGEIEWQKIYGKSGSSDLAQAYDIHQTEEGGYVVAGKWRIHGEWDSDIWIFKLFPDGNMEWQKSYSSSDIHSNFSFQRTDDGGYVLATNNEPPYSSFSGEDILVLRLSSEGDIGPSCGMIGSPSVSVSDTSVSPVNSYSSAVETNGSLLHLDISTQETYAQTEVLCWDLHQPPANISLSVEENRSLFKKELWHVITWNPNPYNDQFIIVEYRIYRSEKGQNDYKLLAIVSSSEFEYMDGPFTDQEEYDYVLTSVDIDGRESPKSWPVSS